MLQRFLGPDARRLLTATVAAGCLLPADGQTAGLCQRVTEAEARQVAPGFTGRLSAEELGELDPQTVPGLPGRLRMDQCVSGMTTRGAISFRLARLTADRALSPAQWREVDRAVSDESNPPAPAGPMPRCERQSARGVGGVMLHELTCQRHEGRQWLTLTVQHDDAARLPPESAVWTLLDKVWARSP
jgi:hypothetical protein